MNTLPSAVEIKLDLVESMSGVVYSSAAVVLMKSGF